MLRILRPLSVSALLLLTTVRGHCADSASQPAAPAPGPLRYALQPLVDRHIIAGAVVLVADKDKVLDLESVGYSRLETREPMQNDDLFWIASMTKSMTATAFMMLVDEGKAKIGDPVEKYLPEFKGQQVVEDGQPPHAPQHPITIREILSHTSGLIPASDPKARSTGSLRDDVVKYAAAPLIREPGTKYQYNNTGINVAGRIIEVLSGMPYAEFMQKRLFDPLEMKDTTFWPNDEQVKRLAWTAKFTEDKANIEDVRIDKNVTQADIDKRRQGVAFPMPMLYNFGIGKASEYGKHYTEPAGGLFSTAADVGKLCQMVLNGGVYKGKRLLSEEAVHEMTTNQTGDVVVNPDEGYGIGWSVKKRQNEGPSIGSYGHRGARRTMMWVDPNNGLVMVLLVERFDMTGEEQKQLYPAFMNAAIERFGKKQRPERRAF